jgi:hypothetical protein
MPRPFRLAVVPAAFLVAASCGYHVAGRGDSLPKEIQTIAVAPFFNYTSRYKIDQYLTRSMTHELLSRTKFKVLPEAGGADAVLRGGVTNIFITPIIADVGTLEKPGTGRATVIQVTAQLQITLTEQKSGRILYQNQNYESREQYEIAVDPKAYFEENEAALQRLSRSVARNVVSAILEQF